MSLPGGYPCDTHPEVTREVTWPPVGGTHGVTPVDTPNGYARKSPVGYPEAHPKSYPKSYPVAPGESPREMHP